MQVTVSRVSPVEVALHISLPQARVNTVLDRAYTELGRVAQVRGFRPGKVPRPILRQYFGDRVANDVFKKLVEESLPRALADQKLEPVNTPSVEPDGIPSETKDFSYTARVEVRPEVPVLDLAALQLTRTNYEISDHDVGHSIDARREQHATSRTPEPARPSQAGDTVTFDYDVELDGKEMEEYRARGRSAELGRSTLIKDIEAGLTGVGAGETRTVSVTFPETIRQQELAGKTAQVKITVHEVREKVLPAVDDDFAKDCGHDTVDALKAALRDELVKQYADKSEQALRDAAVEALVKSNPIAVPPSMTQQVAEQMRQEFIQSFVMRGISLPPDLDSALKAEAEGRVRAGLLLGELARTHGIQVSEEDLNGELDNIAKETGRAVQRLRVEYRDPKKREMLIAGVLEDKVLKLLLSKATIAEVTAPTHDHDHGHDHGHEGTAQE